MIGGLRRSVQLIGWAVLIAAVAKELKKPEGERTWHGTVGGFVPYDFRLPTPDKIRDAYWAPERDEILRDAVFGVGWAVNIPVAARRLSALLSEYRRTSTDL